MTSLQTCFPSGNVVAFYVVIDDWKMPSQKLPTFQVKVVVEEEKLLLILL